ncbi:MAG TPA: hypothetical protein VLW17_06035 [Thermoanaerobaculaceae bacterium]|nr:hypothetical protein [Thermoanaerobaculaceae bacterium]
MHGPGDLQAECLAGLADRIEAAGGDVGPLREFLAGSYATGSEWWGELGLVLRRIAGRDRLDAALRDDLDRVLADVHKVWPQL